MIDPYYVAIGTLFFVGMCMYLLNRLDEWRWAKQKREEQARSHPAE